MPTLVVVYYLVGLVPGRLYGHAVGMVLRLVILRVTDMPTKHYLAHGVYHHIHLRSPHLAVLVPVIQVQFRTVAVPQRIALRRQCSAVLAAEFLAGCLLAVNGIIPQGHDCRTVQPPLHAAKTFQRLPAVGFGTPVRFFKKLRVGIDWHPATLQRYQQLPELVGNLLRVPVAYLAADKARITASFECLDFCLQPRSILWQRMPVLLTHGLRTLVDNLPGSGHASVQALAYGPALRHHTQQFLQHAGIDGVLIDQFLSQVFRLSVLLVGERLIPLACLAVKPYAAFRHRFLHLLFRVAVLRHEPLLVFCGEGTPCVECLTALATSTVNAGNVAATHVLAQCARLDNSLRATSQFCVGHAQYLVEVLHPDFCLQAHRHLFHLVGQCHTVHAHMTAAVLAVIHQLHALAEMKRHRAGRFLMRRFHLFELPIGNTTQLPQGREAYLSSQVAVALEVQRLPYHRVRALEHLPEVCLCFLAYKNLLFHIFVFIIVVL